LEQLFEDLDELVDKEQLDEVVILLQNKEAQGASVAKFVVVELWMASLEILGHLVVEMTPEELGT